MTSFLIHLGGFLAALSVVLAAMVAGGLVTEAVIGEPSWWTVMGMLLGLVLYGINSAYQDHLRDLFDDDDWMS